MSRKTPSSSDSRSRGGQGERQCELQERPSKKVKVTPHVGGQSVADRINSTVHCVKVLRVFSEKKRRPLVEKLVGFSFTDRDFATWSFTDGDIPQPLLQLREQIQAREFNAVASASHVWHGSGPAFLVIGPEAFSRQAAPIFLERRAKQN